MAGHKDLYRWSRLEAERSGELNAWVESYSENCICARAIERAISDGYGENRLNKDCAKKHGLMLTKNFALTPHRMTTPG